VNFPSFCNDKIARAVRSRLRRRSTRIVPALTAFLVGTIFWAGTSQDAIGQSAANQAASGDELRPVFAGAMEISEGKHLAQNNCSNCHGMDGISQIAGVPNLAGQRSTYIYRELHAYISGARNNGAMNGAIKYLSNEALIDAAAYYSSLDPALPAATANSSSGDADPVQAGKAAAAGCSGCHGDAGVSKMPGAPNLAGQQQKYLLDAMAAYKNAQRKNDTMKAMIAMVAGPSMTDIALYYSVQTPKRSQATASGDPRAGQAISAVCASCHGAQGTGANPATPNLAGQDAQFLVAALHGYKDGSRSNATMKSFATGLNDTAIKNLAGYYASLQPQAQNVHKPLSTAQWAERCDRCHGVNGNSTDVTRPALAAQRVDYLQKVLDAYRSGTRQSPEMTAMSSMLSDSDIKNLAAYYARQKARTVIYVPIPSR
jgi:cytochrome c553